MRQKILVNFYVQRQIFKNPICCDHDFIKYSVEVINNVYQNDGIYIPYNKIINLDTLNLFREYFAVVSDFIYDGYVYSLGDSLDKFNYIWNVTHVDEQIVNIPFSGSMYDGIDDSIDIELNPEVETLMQDNLKDLLIHNKNFALLYNDILQGKKILITDYGLSGKAVITIIILLNSLGVTDFRNVTYLQITNDSSIIQHNITIHLHGFAQPNIIYIDEAPDVYFTNSDRPYMGFNSRCVPRYEVGNWKEVPDDVWYQGLIPNYSLCNIHRRFLLFQLCCTLNDFFEDNF